MGAGIAELDTIRQVPKGMPKNFKVPEGANPDFDAVLDQKVGRTF